MIRALVKGVLTESKKGEKGICPFCNGEMIAKCGDLRIWHWAHKFAECDTWQGGKETEWHLKWKRKVGLEFSEKRIEKDGIFHIADILIPGRNGRNDLIIELQNSPLAKEDILKREAFYGKGLIWVLNGTEHKITVDRNFIKSDLKNWKYDPYIDYYFFDGEVQCGRFALVINVPYSNHSSEYEKFLFSEGFLKDDRSEDLKRTILEKTRYFKRYLGSSVGLKYYKKAEALVVDDWMEYVKEFQAKRERLIFKINSDFLKPAMNKGVIPQVHYTWKYSRTAFRYANNPVFIDLNNSELIQIEKGRTARGLGKLIEKARFMQRIQERINETSCLI
jgi:competence CoiA-like predicted nuclease